MERFISHLLFCSFLLCIITCIFLLIKKLLVKILSKTLNYYLWLILMGLFAVPFFSLLPWLRLPSFSWNTYFPYNSFSTDRIFEQPSATLSVSDSATWMKDFALSVHHQNLSLLFNILFFVWVAGVLTMSVYLVRSLFLLCNLHRNSLPLQHRDTMLVYRSCLEKLKIRRSIPVYISRSIHSPAMTGILRPRIYLPADVISDSSRTDLHYIFLHELFHYRHRDSMISSLMNLLCTLYWFHPFVWLILRNMRSDREIACDASVLEHLDENSYYAYGHTLLNFVQRKTLGSCPLVSKLSGSKHQIQKRILLISSYQKMTLQKKCQSFCTFLFTVILLSSFVPFLSSDASDSTSVQKSVVASSTSFLDLNAYFDGYEGCFLFYDMDTENLTVYNENQADIRVSPDSTYKIYDSLFALDQGIIHPEDSFLTWSGTEYPFPEWNQDQTLKSAMAASVNWYFQSLDADMGYDTIRSYLQRIDYGNKDVTGNLDSYWMESSLKISPSEQLSLLLSFYRNDWGFNPEHVETVKNALLLSSSSDSVLYGKTGTGQVDGVNRNGWFIGFAEASGHTFFFVTNLQGNGASGSTAASITLSILSDMKLYS